MEAHALRHEDLQRWETEAWRACSAHKISSLESIPPPTLEYPGRAIGIFDWNGMPVRNTAIKTPSKKPNVPFLRGNGRSAILDRACTSRSLVVAHARFVVDTPVLHGFVCNDIEFLGVFIFE